MKAVSVFLFAGLLGSAFAPPCSAAEGASFTEKVLWSFAGGRDAQFPAAGLIELDGTFYGTTRAGGIYGEGTAFALDAATDAEKVLYFFCQKGEYCLDGSSPWGGLVDVSGKLYGTTPLGGANCNSSGGCGTVFSLDPGTGKEKVVYSFAGGPYDGAAPTGTLIDLKGVLYGTTDTGGASNFGTAFALDGKSETVLYFFCSQSHCVDGQNPALGLTDVKDTLYGTTVAGGANYTQCQNAGCGVVYALDPETGAETVLYSFAGGSTDGWAPEGNVISANGTLYGTTVWGGVTGCDAHTGCGIVFSLDPGTGAERVLYYFCRQTNCTDGAEPQAGLIDMNDKLYGTTSAGGVAGCDGNGCGTVFSVDPGTGAERVLYSFCSQKNCADGAYPVAGLIAVSGKLYGTTYEGGAYGSGTVFELVKR